METMRLYLVPADFVDCRACEYEEQGKWDGAASVAHTCEEFCPDCSPYRDDEELFNDEFHGRCLTCGYESDRLRAISEEADRLRKGE
jgi:hypothetical protein